MTETKLGFAFEPKKVTADGIVEAIHKLAWGYNRLADLLLHLLVLQSYALVPPSPLKKEFVETTVLPHILSEREHFEQMLLDTNQYKALLADLEQILGGRLVPTAKVSTMASPVEDSVTPGGTSFRPEA